jgi:hypothetical protein
MNECRDGVNKNEKYEARKEERKKERQKERKKERKRVYCHEFIVVTN